MTKLVEKKLSTDGSYKFLFQPQNTPHYYEALYFKFAEAKGAAETPICCLSSQVGCSMGCVFCATGQLGFKENLNTSTLLETAKLILSNLGPGDAPPEILTFMGMGEPLLNVEPLIEFYNLAVTELKVKKLSLSTIVIPKKLHYLAESPANYDLFVSLHSSSEDQRKRLIPNFRQYTFEDLFEACRYYYQKKLVYLNSKIKFSYLLLEGINDSLADISGLASLLKNNFAADEYRVQLLLHNEIKGGDCKKIAVQEAYKIQDILLKSGIDAYLSLSRGTDVGGGCGQFVGLRQDK